MALKHNKEGRQSGELGQERCWRHQLTSGFRRSLGIELLRVVVPTYALQ